MSMIKSLRFPEMTSAKFWDASQRDNFVEFDVEACGRNGTGRVEVRPDGYWSDVITLRIRREYDWTTNRSVWRIELSHSSGGRLLKTDEKHYTKERGYVGIESDLDAELIFAVALLNTAGFGKELERNFDAMEYWHGVQEEENKARSAKEEAAKLAAIEADAPLGVNKAKALILNARARLQSGRAVVLINYTQRGVDVWHQAEGRFSRNGSVVWSLFGNRISEKELLQALADSSHRSALAQ